MPPGSRRSPSSAPDGLDTFGTLLRVASRAAEDVDALADASPFEAAVRDVLHAAVAALPGATAASITHRSRPERRPRTLAATDQVAARLDHVQDGLDEGPCHDVVHTDVGVVEVADVTRDARWPQLADALRHDGVPPLGATSQALAVPVPHQAALNVYRTAGDGTVASDRLADAADAVGLGLTALLHAQSAAHLTRAVESNRRIGIAIGVLMTQRGCTEAQAFDLMRRSSQNANVKLRDVAEYVILAGALPTPDRSTDGGR